MNKRKIKKLLKGCRKAIITDIIGINMTYNYKFANYTKKAIIIDVYNEEGIGVEYWCIPYDWIRKVVVIE